MSINYSFGFPLKHNFAEQIYYQGLFLPNEMDMILKLWDEQKTIKAILSDGEGGDLQFMANQEVINAPREKGTIIIFPILCDASYNTNYKRNTSINCGLDFWSTV